MGYNEEKAKRMYDLFVKGLPCKKVYAAVEKEGKFIVLKNPEGRKYRYSIAGGGVEDGENNDEAIKRELNEELNINVEIVKSLGLLNWKQVWKYEEKEFEMPYEAEVFLTKFVSYSDNNSFGLEGEFNNTIITISEISKEEMLNNVYEFIVGGINF